MSQWAWAARMAPCDKADYDWNDHVIRAGGPRITMWINGVQGVDYTEAGPVNLRVNGRKLDFMIEPCAGKGPPAIGGGGGDAQDIGGFIYLQANEVAEFDKFGLPWFEGSEALKGIVEGEELVVGLRAGDLDIVHVEVTGPGTAALR